jgi:predicted transcriptional regulator of viral defense system
MPIIKYNKVLQRVFKKIVFRVDDIVNEGIPQAYAKKVLHLLSKTGRIKRIERGKYTTSDDPVAVAAHITHPCYISLWTAMSIRRITTQIPFAVEVVTSRKRFKRKIEFEGVPIIFYTVSPKMMFGYENVIWKENVRIAVAKPEKVIIDALYLGKIPFDELKEAVRVSDVKILKEYSKLTGDEKIVQTVKRLIEKKKRRG